MKVTCDRATLAAAFQTVAGVVPTRTPKAILQNIKLQATDRDVVLIGTDQEVGIRYRLGTANVERPGEVLLPTARTLAILREMPGTEVRIEATPEATFILGERSEYQLGAVDPAEFPPVSDFDEQNYYIVDPAVFRQLIRRTSFATDTESSRYALGGVMVDIKGDSATLAATDTRRLAVAKGTVSTSGKEPGEIAPPIVPAKALSLLERSLANATEPVHLAIRNNDVLVRTESITIYSRLVEGRFPRYQDVIPPPNDNAVQFVAQPFYSAVRQAQIVTSDESRGVDFVFSNGLLTLKSRAADVGESKVELPVVYEGAEITITLDPRFVADFLKVLEPEQSLRLELTDSESAAVFRTEDGYIYIIMPLSRDR